MALLIRIRSDRPLIETFRRPRREPDELVDDRRPRTLRHVYRMALEIGWPVEVAASWAAWSVGLPPTSEHGFRPWTIAQIEALIFLRSTRDRWR
jgi:hypothetical protein